MGEVLTQGVYIRRARGVQELSKARQNIRLTILAAQSCEECKHGAGVIKLASRNCLQGGNAVSALATPGVHPITFCVMLFYSNLYRMPAPVYHMHYSRYSCGSD